MIDDSNHLTTYGSNDSDGFRILAWPWLRQGRNPYTEKLYEALAEESPNTTIAEFSVRSALTHSHDVVHIHWPENTCRGTAFIAISRCVVLVIVLIIARARGASLVWTIHNLVSHEARHPRVELGLRKCLIRLTDAFLTLTDAARRLLLEAHPTIDPARCYVTPHGHYIGIYPNDVAKEQARARLGLPADSRVALFMGQIRPYKRVPFLIEVFSDLPGEQYRLVVAGKAASSELAEQVARRATDGRILLHLGYVAEPEVQLYLNAADVIALPYAEVLNSGTVLLALSFGRPVLVPNKGSMPELAAVFGETWVRCYGHEMTTADLLSALTAPQPNESTLTDLSKALDREASWTRVAILTSEAYAEAIKFRTRHSTYRRIRQKNRHIG